MNVNTFIISSVAPEICVFMDGTWYVMSQNGTTRTSSALIIEIIKELGTKTPANFA